MDSIGDLSPRGAVPLSLRLSKTAANNRQTGFCTEVCTQCNSLAVFNVLVNGGAHGG